MKVYGLTCSWPDYVGSAGLFRTPTYIYIYIYTYIYIYIYIAKETNCKRMLYIYIYILQRKQIVNECCLYTYIYFFSYALIYQRVWAPNPLVRRGCVVTVCACARLVAPHFCGQAAECVRVRVKIISRLLVSGIRLFLNVGPLSHLQWLTFRWGVWFVVTLVWWPPSLRKTDLMWLVKSRFCCTCLSAFAALPARLPPVPNCTHTHLLAKISTYFQHWQPTYLPYLTPRGQRSPYTHCRQSPDQFLHPPPCLPTH